VAEKGGGAEAEAARQGAGVEGGAEEGAGGGGAFVNERRERYGEFLERRKLKPIPPSLPP
jgi:hypothetical protein